ncbi:unnamed protein product [Didymodactylos carnosus]|uniref:Uncharacterized protein n=1 Tax=Didymodactylos carnosus TaxID=1234261 RepID=A0A8S2ESN8_9BILA|nr:unnamed protein product [Didymodactylos carnosus]CAF4036493.1 unnamed protein product [Didymodactylos carnosus]
MKISSVDRSRVDPLTILGVVVNVDHNGLHTTGCRGGTINTKYNRKDLEHCETILKPTAVDSTSLPRHSIVANESLVGGQGLFHCDCRRGCETNRCKCKKNSVSCNSRCHSSMPCKNKT